MEKTAKKRFFQSEASLNLLYLPALGLFLTFIIYPFIQGVVISASDWNGFDPSYNYVGLQKYKEVFTDPEMYMVLKNTFIYGIGSTLFQNIIGLLYALFLDSKLKIKELVKTIVYLPVIIAPVIMGQIWYFFFQYERGAVNDILIWLGKEPVLWLEKGEISVWIIMGANTLQYLGIAMMVYLAGLQAIPKEYFEAGEIDGAHGIKKFKEITLPLLMPSITINIIINLIGGLKLFDVIQTMTQGGPGYQSASLSTMMYKLYFFWQDAGKAAALGIFMFVLISVLSIFSLVNLRKREVEI
jgi:raffinose/stachyose/melibiose transport system permease protein